MKKKKKSKRNKNSIFKRFKNIISKFKNSLFDEKDENDNSKSSFTIVEVIIVVSIALVFGIVIGIFIMYSSPIDIGRKSRLNEIVNTYNDIMDEYYEKIDEDKLADAAIKGMIDSLSDPYSNYMDNSTTDEFNETVDGSFVGIGITVTYNGEYNTVIEVNENGPADKAGIKVDDVILKVGGVSCQNIYGDELTKLVRGKKKTVVEVVVKRGEEEKTFSVTRDTIEVKSVIEDVITYNDKKIGYISITAFSLNTANQFKTAISKLEKKNVSSLVIDLRNNPGGHLTQVREILSMFFDKKTVLYQIESKNTKKKVYALNNDYKTLPVAIIIDGGSASAAEIMASAFKEQYDKCVVVGETSFGKGSVQKSKSLSDGSSIKYTTQKWLTSRGEWLNGSGVVPDFEVTLEDEYYENPIRDNDLQLQEALKRVVEIK